MRHLGRTIYILGAIAGATASALDTDEIFHDPKKVRIQTSNPYSYSVATGDSLDHALPRLAEHFFARVLNNPLAPIDSDDPAFEILAERLMPFLPPDDPKYQQNPQQLGLDFLERIQPKLESQTAQTVAKEFARAVRLPKGQLRQEIREGLENKKSPFLLFARLMAWKHYLKNVQPLAESAGTLPENLLISLDEILRSNAPETLAHLVEDSAGLISEKPNLLSRTFEQLSRPQFGVSPKDAETKQAALIQTVKHLRERPGEEFPPLNSATDAVAGGIDDNARNVHGLTSRAVQVFNGDRRRLFEQLFALVDVRAEGNPPQLVYHRRAELSPDKFQEATKALSTWGPHLLPMIDTLANQGPLRVNDAGNLWHVGGIEPRRLLHTALFDDTAGGVKVVGNTPPNNPANTGGNTTGGQNNGHPTSGGTVAPAGGTPPAPVEKTIQDPTQLTSRVFADNRGAGTGRNVDTWLGGGTTPTVSLPTRNSGQTGESGGSKSSVATGPGQPPPPPAAPPANPPPTGENTAAQNPPPPSPPNRDSRRSTAPEGEAPTRGLNVGEGDHRASNAPSGPFSRSRPATRTRFSPQALPFSARAATGKPGLTRGAPGGTAMSTMQTPSLGPPPSARGAVGNPSPASAPGTGGVPIASGGSIGSGGPPTNSLSASFFSSPFERRPIPDEGRSRREPASELVDGPDANFARPGQGEIVSERKVRSAPSAPPPSRVISESEDITTAPDKRDPSVTVRTEEKKTVGTNFKRTAKKVFRRDAKGSLLSYVDSVLETREQDGKKIETKTDTTHDLGTLKPLEVKTVVTTTDRTGAVTISTTVEKLASVNCPRSKVETLETKAGPPVPRLITTTTYDAFCHATHVDKRSEDPSAAAMPPILGQAGG